MREIMIRANDKNGESILIGDTIKGEEYFCPTCGKPLIIKAKDPDAAVRPYFSHRPNTHCTDNWKYDMSEWHRAWQEKFPKQCREIVLENNGIKHRADVLINNTVIEFQHSPITHEEILERNKFYLSCGYPVVWVFDAKSPTYKIKNKDKNNNCIDPMKCKEDTLCWNRAKPQFKPIVQKGVNVYIQYKTTVSTPQKEYNGKEFDILLFLTELTPKDFKFLRLNAYILQENFLQQYGVNTGWNSIQQIINATYPPKIQYPKDIVHRPIIRRVAPNPIEAQSMIQQFSRGGLKRYPVKPSKKTDYHRKPRRR